MTNLQIQEFYNLYEVSERAALKFLKEAELIPSELESLYNKVKRMNRIYEQQGFETEEGYEEYVEAKIDLFLSLGIEDPALNESVEEPQEEVITEALQKDTNVYDLFTYWEVPVEDIKDEYKEDYREIAEENESDGVIAPAIDIEDFSSAEYFSFENDDFLYYVKDQLFEGGDYVAYLAFSYGMNYRGDFAYNISRELDNLVFFEYDASLYFEEKGRDYIKFKLASHDVPMGSDYYILGLSQEDYDIIDNADFEIIQHFIEATIGIE